MLVKTIIKYRMVAFPVKRKGIMRLLEKLYGIYKPAKFNINAMDTG